MEKKIIEQGDVEPIELEIIGDSDIDIWQNGVVVSLDKTGVRALRDALNEVLGEMLGEWKPVGNDTPNQCVLLITNGKTVVPAIWMGGKEMFKNPTHPAYYHPEEFTHYMEITLPQPPKDI